MGSFEGPPTGAFEATATSPIPAATERVYPGHFTINAAGGGYGGDTTWPGLDSWQMVGPYLQLGRTRLVLDYFDFVPHACGVLQEDLNSYTVYSVSFGDCHLRVQCCHPHREGERQPGLYPHSRPCVT